MRRTLLGIIISSFLLTACGLLARRVVAPNGPMWYGRWEDTFSSNGERIYMTATNNQGEQIEYSGGPGLGGMMMGAYLTCASCHAADGRGGVHTMHMQIMDAPDIRYTSLAEEAEEHGAGDHEDEHGEYDLEDFRQAVIEGKHPDGNELSQDMPRWQINDDDLADLFEFLKSLP